MKTHILMAIATIASLILLGPADAAEKILGKRQVPKAVIDAFEKSHPNAKGVEFEQEVFQGKKAYEVEYKEDGKEYELIYGTDGAILQKEETIDAKALPEAVVQAVNKAYPTATIIEAEQLMKPDGIATGYEVELKAGKKEYQVDLDLSGKILKAEED